MLSKMGACSANIGSLVSVKIFENCRHRKPRLKIGSSADEQSFIQKGIKFLTFSKRFSRNIFAELVISNPLIRELRRT